MPLLEAKILYNYQVDTSCGILEVPTSNNFALVNNIAPEVESVIGIGLKALSVDFSTIPASQQALQISLLGTGSNLDINKEAAYRK